MKLPIRLFLVLVLLVTLGLALSSGVWAQQGSWQFDPQVTEVGKNAERARQFLYWIFTHPPSYTVPVLAQIWGISRNIVYALFILVIAITGLAFILARRSGNLGPIFSGLSSPIFGISVPTLFFRIGILLIYVTFSYLLVLGLIQTSEIASRFFIEKFQGCRLFNISFTTGSAPLDCNSASDPETISKMEKNYLEFVGYKDPNLLNQESANTGLLLVRLTTLTYNVMSVVLILRQVILWFLLMVAPFLAILMPFLLIRNTGYIWIGVFFQWLFYGPLVSLFIAGLSQIWIRGIPYAFNFTRINKIDSQVFPTSINILYGGPAQLLSPTNSANYIDTYAEYIISLIMLWVAVFLPWLLLKIFRDYCCDILQKNHAVLLSILDKFRGVGTPPPQPSLSGPEASIQLPFRKSVGEVNKITLKRFEDISTAKTNELTRSLSLSVSSLSEVARYEMDTKERKQVIETLNHIANPFIIPTAQDRERYSLIKKELETRAKAGDKQAQLVLAAALKQPAMISALPVSREFPEITIKEAINTLVRETSLTSEKVSELLKELPQISINNQVNVLAEGVQVPQIRVEQALNSLPQFAPTGVNTTTLLAENPYLAGEIAKRTELTEEKVREVLSQFSDSTLSQTERIEKVANETTVSSEQIRELLTRLPDVIVSVYPQILEKASQNTEIVNTVSQSTSVSQEKVKQVLQQTRLLEAKKLSEEELISRVSEQTSITKEKTKEVLETLNSLTTKAYSKEELVTKIAEKTSLSQEKVSEILNKIEQVKNTREIFTQEAIQKIADTAKVSTEQVQTIVKSASQAIPQFAPDLIAGLIKEPAVLARMVEETGLPQESIVKILEQVAKLTPSKTLFEDQVEMVAEMANLSEDKVKNILGTVAAVRLGKPDVGKPKVARRPAVSVEDYEEVKNMWTNHYKLSEVPASEKIKSRNDWVNEDIRVLTNALNLLTSLNPKDKEKGMKEVANILPFLLLGGFSEVETVIYLKAKLQAAKLTLAQLEEREKLKEEVKKEEEETLVEISGEKPKEEAKTFEEQQEQVMEIPKEEENKTIKDKPE